MGKLSIGVVKFYNHGVISAVIGIRNVRLSHLLMSFWFGVLIHAVD